MELTKENLEKELKRQLDKLYVELNDSVRDTEKNPNNPTARTARHLIAHEIDTLEHLARKFKLKPRR